MKKIYLGLSLGISFAACLAFSITASAESVRYEAENAIISIEDGSSAVKTSFVNKDTAPADNVGYSGTGFVGEYDSDRTLTFNVNCEEAGTYDVFVKIGAGDWVGCAGKTVTFNANGGASAVIDLSNLNPGKWGIFKTQLELQKGDSEIVVTPDKQIGIDYIELENADYELYEAENATAYGNVGVANNVTGMSGTGFQYFLGNPSDELEWTVTAAEAGNYDVFFRYSTDNEDKFSLLVNDVETTTFTVGPEKIFTLPNVSPDGNTKPLWKESWTNSARYNVTLKAGENKIKLKSNELYGSYAWTQIDYMGVSSNSVTQYDIEPYADDDTRQWTMYNNMAGYIGNGFYWPGATAGNHIVWKPVVSGDGYRKVTFRYASSADDYLTLNVNGAAYKNLQFKPSAKGLAAQQVFGDDVDNFNDYVKHCWTEVSAYVYLKDGENTIEAVVPEFDSPTMYGTLNMQYLSIDENVIYNGVDVFYNFDKVDVSEISDGKINITSNVSINENGTNSFSISPQIITAFYKDNRFVDCEIKPLLGVIPDSDVDSISYTQSVSVDEQDADTVKVFVFDSFDTIKPLQDLTEIDLSLN